MMPVEHGYADPPWDLGWVMNQLRSYTYKPGWTFAAEEIPIFASYFDIVVKVEFFTQDSRNHDRMIPITMSEIVPERSIGNQDLFARWFQSILFRFERHESQEWFRINGQIYDDPHKVRN